jgi:hypothetical protein
MVYSWLELPDLLWIIETQPYGIYDFKGMVIAFSRKISSDI